MKIVINSDDYGMSLVASSVNIYIGRVNILFASIEANRLIDVFNGPRVLTDPNWKADINSHVLYYRDDGNEV